MHPTVTTAADDQVPPRGFKYPGYVMPEAERRAHEAKYLDAAGDAGLPQQPQQRSPTGVTTMFEIVPAEPQQPLVGPFLATAEETVLYGPGGAGKGTFAAWLTLEYLRQDSAARVYVLDFEHRQSEWSGRLRRLGASDIKLAKVFYVSPFSAKWAAPSGGRALSQIVEHVKSDCDRLGISLLIVDSYSAATSTGDAMGGQAAANEYFEALRRIGRRSLTLAHVPGNSQKWPDKPFGSIFVKNWSREMWAIEWVEMDGLTGEDEHGLSYHRVELHCTKAQDRERPAHQRVTFTYEPHHGAITADLEQLIPSHGSLAYDALRQTPGVRLDLKAIAKAIKADTGETLTETQVYDAIRRRQRSKDDIQSDKSKRPFKFWVEG